jgi:hypothetical protein
MALRPKNKAEKLPNGIAVNFLLLFH